MDNLNRRKFVAAVGGVLLLPALAGASTASFAIRAISGRRVIGLLTTTDPEAHERAIAALRVRHGYDRTLAYTSTDRLKLPFAHALIDHVANASDIRFATEVGPQREEGEPRCGDYPELAQLAAFLTGCAYGSSTGTQHPVKRELIDALRAKTNFIV